MSRGTHRTDIEKDKREAELAEQEQKQTAETASALEEMKQQIEKLKAENATLKEQHGESELMSRRIDHLSAELQKLRAETTLPTDVSEYQRRIAYEEQKLKSWETRIRAEQKKAVDELLEGDKLFVVKLDGNPERLVGGDHPAIAEKKYLRYFRINQTTHPVSVEEVGSVNDLKSDEARYKALTKVPHGFDDDD